MTPRPWLAIALFSLLPQVHAARTGIIQVTSVRSWSHPTSTRVILQTTGPFEFRSDRAVNPDRLFFDIPNARPWINEKRLAVQQVNDALVQRVRIAETAPDTTRVVFDLTGPVSFTVTRLEAPDRMVIEVRPVGTGPALATPEPTVQSKIRRDFVWPTLPPRRARSVFYAGLPPSITVSIPAAWAVPDGIATGLPPVPKAQKRIEVAYSPAVLAPAVLVPPVVAPSVGHSAPKAPAPTRIPVASVPDMGTRSMTRALGLRVNRIVIDAGHGGHDEGTSGPHGVLEKEVVLDVALRLSKLVQSRLGAEVVLTRSDDTFIPLTERTAIANDRKADLFLSIHANSSSMPTVAGTETFFLNFTSNPTALDVASRENAGSEKSIGELKDLIQSITLNDKIAESQTLAQAVQNSIYSQVAKSNAAARNRGVKRAPFVVLIGASMPSVLAEIGFLTNPRDESNLSKPEHRQKIAEALYRGVAQYSQSLGQLSTSAKVSSKAEKPERRTAGAN